jgi:predicted SAM-dependent methyltransferase
MFLNSYKNPYLNLGCGAKIHSDWINIDFVSASDEILKYNLLEKLPLEDNCIEYIYHSHLLEHFRESEGLTFLQECFRLLQAGGIVRIVLPDLENIIRCYINLIDNKSKYSEPEFFKYHHWLIVELFDQTVREFRGGLMKESLITEDQELLEFIKTRIGFIKITESKTFPGRKPLFLRIKRKLTKMLLTKAEYEALNIGLFRNSGEIHKWMYDRYSLSRLLSEIGFKQVEIKDPYTSNIPFWGNYEFDVKDNLILNPSSLYIEAIK